MYVQIVEKQNQFSAFHIHLDHLIALCRTTHLFLKTRFLGKEIKAISMKLVDYISEISNNDEADLSTTESDPCSLDAESADLDTPVLIENLKQDVKTKDIVEKKALKKEQELSEPNGSQLFAI